MADESARTQRQVTYICLDEVDIPSSGVAQLGSAGTEGFPAKVHRDKPAASRGEGAGHSARAASRLEQDVPLSANKSVFDVVAEGHTHHLEEDEAWLKEHHVDVVLSRLALPADAMAAIDGSNWNPR